jgi:hypothetical protein
MDPQPAMKITARTLCESALLYPQDIALAPAVLSLVEMSQANYRQATFLDDRILENVRTVGWIPFEAVSTAAAIIQPLPLSFIFHAGHVGSTLLSRLLDEVPGVLGLREPVPLRRLAMSELDRREISRWLKLLLPLWGRGFPDVSRVIVKATSSVGHLAPQLMAEAPQLRAVYLNMRPEPFLAVLLAGDATRGDLEQMTHFRLARLRGHLGEDLDQERALTIGEGAAVAWVTERLAQARTAASAGERLLELDFDDMLADMPAALWRVLAHFALPPELAASLAQSPILGQYSKLAGDHPYSPQLRRQTMDQARYLHGDEIALGMALIERLAARHPQLAVLLD